MIFNRFFHAKTIEECYKTTLILLLGWPADPGAASRLEKSLREFLNKLESLNKTLGSKQTNKQMKEESGIS